MVDLEKHAEAILRAAGVIALPKDWSAKYRSATLAALTALADEVAGEMRGAAYITAASETPNAADVQDVTEAWARGYMVGTATASLAIRKLPLPSEKIASQCPPAVQLGACGRPAHETDPLTPCLGDLVEQEGHIECEQCGWTPSLPSERKRGMGWQDISTAPRTGERVWVRRVFKGRIVKEGWAVWSTNSDDAPMRQWADGGLLGPIPPDHAYADTERWLNEDRRFSFPTPTEWLPEKTHDPA